MKLTTYLLALFTASSVYASVDYVKANSCEISLGRDYKECFEYENITKDKLESTCKAYQSDKCQKLYNEGVTILQDCKELDLETRTYVNTKYEVMYVHLDFFICSKDEDYKSCPITKYYVVEEGDDMDARTAFNQFINETCKSKKCTDAAIAATKKEIELRKGTDFEPKTKFDRSKIDKAFDGATVADEDEVAYMVAFLESSFCSSQYKGTDSSQSNSTTDNVSTSEATTQKFNSILLFTFVLLFTLI